MLGIALVVLKISLLSGRSNSWTCLVPGRLGIYVYYQHQRVVLVI